MSERFGMAISQPAVEVAKDSPADLLCGFTATLEIHGGAERWCDEHFPVLELALALRRVKPVQTLHFSSMCMEEDPALAVLIGSRVTTVTMYDGTSIAAPSDPVVAAIDAFLEEVDHAFQKLCGRSLEEFERSLA